MAHLNSDSPFQSWVLSPEEFSQGSILTSLQKRCIQNQIWQAAIKRLNIKYDPALPMEFLQEEAELKGVISALQFLLDNSTQQEKQFDPGLSPQNLDFPSSSN